MRAIVNTKWFYPEGVTDVDAVQVWLEMTLDALPHEVAEAAVLCAVPAWFDQRLLALLTGADDILTLVLLSQLLAAGLVTRVEEGGYRFYPPIRERILEMWQTSDHWDHYVSLLLWLADYYLPLIEEQAVCLQGAGREHALAMFDKFYPNLEAIWEGMVTMGHARWVRKLVIVLDTYFAQRNRWEQRLSWLESGIAACEALGDTQTRAQMLNDLGFTYTQLPTGNPLENVREAIACYEAALAIFTPETAPLEYAMVQNNLGTAYLHGRSVDPAADIRQAIACYKRSLRTCTLERAPQLYALINANLGFAYATLSGGEKMESVRQAIAAYREVLKVYTPETAPLAYANVQNNLGLLYAQLQGQDRESALREAIVCFKEALRFQWMERESLAIAEPCDGSSDLLVAQEHLQAMYELLARYYAHQGETQRVQSLYRELSALCGSDHQRSRFWLAVGEIYFRLGQIGEAIAAFRQAIALDAAQVEIPVLLNAT
ncbi:MAG: tetratricopeptide repeat protein [Anaerolineae bacterium]|nr:tetratricopeptide repeat protein [Anaerolineae bacterium]